MRAEPEEKGYAMTKKDYEQIAKMIYRHRENDEDGTRSGTIAEVAFSLARIFAEDNARFNGARFFSACGMDDNGGWI